MAHFAQIDDNNIVTQVLVVPDEQQYRGQDYLSNDLMLGGRWVQTSYNGNMRGMFAGIGYSYNQDLNTFISPKPFPSWILNNNLGIWESPIEKPNDEEGKVWIWDEENQQWNQEDLPTPIIS
jgi:hypothetical protein